MTCIVGYKSMGRVYIGGDSAGVAGYSITTRKDPKVFMNGELAFGFTSSFRFGQILQYELSPPKHHPDTSTMKYMVSQLVPAIRQALKEHGYMYVKESNESGGACLIGYRGQLFLMDSDFQIGESVDDFDAVGCGIDLALGAMHAIKKIDPEMSPEGAIELALQAAETYSAGVKGPFRIVFSERFKINQEAA
jgi:ATP-dependent protease HslVU (ClpYQ) peptidase subunit